MTSHLEHSTQRHKTGEHGVSLDEPGVGGSELVPHVPPPPLGRVMDRLQGIGEPPKLCAELCV